MPDLRVPLAATHVHPEAGRGVNTPGLFRPAFNSALFFPSFWPLLAYREKETDRTEPCTRIRALATRVSPVSTERNIAVIRHETAPRSKKAKGRSRNRAVKFLV